jgi:hypothetical protein
MSILGFKNRYWKNFFFKFKGTVSREEYETGFNVYTTIEMNLLVEFTNPANDGLRTFIYRTVNTSYELKATSYER